MTNLPSVTLIVLNWNAGDFLPACLSSLLKLDYPNYDVVVVDNGSTDGSVAAVEAQFPQVRLCCNERNRGFAAGNNVGLRQADSDFSALVNPDVIVTEGWLRQLIAPLLEDETIGVAGCKLYYPDGKLLQHAGGYLTEPQAFPGHFGLGEVDEGQYDELRDVDYVIGAAIAIRRRVLEEVGFLDEGYFLYYEEADLCARARRAGYRVVYVPRATAVHHESATLARESDFYWQQMFTSRWRFLLKHYLLGNVLQETIPAEKEWLAGLSPQHRRAAAHAYRTTFRQLDEILAARERDGMTSTTAEETKAIAAELQQLRQLAWQPSPLGTGQLQAGAVVQERPFRSHVLLFGPLIAWFRQTWNSISTRWYVRPLLQQQNDFNQHLVQRLQEHTARLTAQEQAQVELIQDAAELTEQLKEMNRLLQSIDERLAHLEAARFGKG
ncbi:MAG TPA: glycosyltransferase family 2 protein [Anaerolineae bacterium]